MEYGRLDKRPQSASQNSEKKNNSKKIIKQNGSSVNCDKQMICYLDSLGHFPKAGRSSTSWIYQPLQSGGKDIMCKVVRIMEDWTFRIIQNRYPFYDNTITPPAIPVQLLFRFLFLNVGIAALGPLLYNTPFLSKLIQAPRFKYQNANDFHVYIPQPGWLQTCKYAPTQVHIWITTRMT